MKAHAIGFANQYYTLWHLQVEPIYTEVRGEYRHSGDKCTRTYYQNLSKDLVKAQQKFEQGIKYMRSLYINRYDYLRSSMIVSSHGVSSNPRLA